MVLKNKLSGEDLNRVQVKMLASSNVPHVLDLHVREVDNEAQLHYNIGGKRMLSTCIKTEKITLVEYYALLLQIVTALEYGMTYMLSPNGFLLQEDYMFVDGALSEGTVYLTYLPLNKSAELAPSRERIGGLAARWMAYIDDLRGSGVQRILQMCEQSSFSLQALKSLLIGLLAGSGKQPTGNLVAAGAAATQTSYPIHEQSGISHQSERFNAMPNNYAAAPNGGVAYAEPAVPFPVHSLPMSTQTQAPSAATQSDQHHVRLDAGKLQSNLEPSLNQQAELSNTSEEESKKDKNGRLVVPLISMMLLALLWKFLYLDSPSTINLLICVVATPIILVFAYLGWARKLKFNKRSADRIDEQEEAAALSMPWQEPRATSTGQRVFYGQPEVASAAPMQSENFQVPDFLKPASSRQAERTEYSSGMQPQIASQDAVPNYAADSATGVLSSPAYQPTVVLGSGQDGFTNAAGQASSSSYRLERLENGSLPKSIVLPTGSFTIGRSEEVAQHVETAAGISRAHVELALSTAHCTIKDMGSRNGTKLNDEVLTPYKAYDLNEGDTFKIAGISYTLRCG
nr:DUF6382 domain-containing protein [Saccharibacillus sp. JS10]